MKGKKLISGLLSLAVALSGFSAFASSEKQDAVRVKEAMAYVDESGQVTEKNIDVYTGDTGLDIMSVKGGRKGWLFDITSSNADYYLYMNVDDSFADSYDKGRIIEVSVDYFDAGTSSFTLEYTNGNGKVIEAPYKEFEGSLTWKNHTFVLYDAFLSNGVNGADMRLASKTKNMATSFENFVISGVSVRVTDKFSQLNIKAETDHYGNNFFTGEQIKFSYTIDNGRIPVESHIRGTYPVNAKFVAKSLEGVELFTKEDVIELKPCKTVKYDLDIDVGGRYGVYFLTAIFENTQKGIYSEDTTRFSYVRTDYGKTMNYSFGTCAGRRVEFAPLLRNAGIGKVRTMQSYTNVASNNVEAKDAFYFPASGFSLQRAMRELNIGTFNTYLSVSGDFAEGEHAPHTEKGIEAFLDYTNYVTDVERYGVDSYDMWNEWDLMGASFNRYARPIEDYINLMKITYTEMKSKYPELKFWGGVSSTVNIAWLKKILQNGGGDYMDGYCVHAYKVQYDPMSGGAVELVQQLRDLLDEYGYYDMPILTSELGFADDTYYGIDELRQGYYLVEYYVALNKIRGFEDYVMYIFQDNGVVKGNREHHWGLIEFSGAKTPGTAKASYAMVANMNQMLAGYKYAQDITLNDDTYAYRMHSEEKDDDVIFLWSRGNGGTVSIDLGTDSVEMYDEYGNLTTLTGADGVYTFALNEAPVYIKGDIKKFEKSDNGIISDNGFDIEFAKDFDIRINNPGTEKLTVEAVPYDNKDLKFTITENEDGSVNLFADTQRSKSYRDMAYLKVSSGDKVYMNGKLVFEYKTPLGMEMTAEPAVGADGKYDYGNINIRVNLTNSGSNELKGKLLINEFEGAGDYKKEYDGIEIPSGETKSVLMNVSSDSGRFSMDATFVTDGGTAIDFSKKASYATCDYAYTKPETDGKISEGEYSKKIYLGADDVTSIHSVDMYSGADDLSANLSYAWDEENLYIAMECIDNTLYAESPAASSMWRYDSFQFAAAYDPENKYDSSQLVSVLYGTTGGKQALEMVVNKAIQKMNDPKHGFVGAMGREGKSTIYEVKVPWKTILMEEREVLPDTVLKFAALANDNDGAGRKAAIQYGEGIYAGSKSSDLFMRMYLVKEEQK